MKNYSILIADSGSTKTDWALVPVKGSQTLIQTQGINPFHQDEAAIACILHDELLPQLTTDEVGLVYFYGSGVRPELVGKMVTLLGEAFPAATQIEAHSDMLGAARALCGHNEGIACILGTGANSCLFDGTEILMNTPPLGYILGDEGSGAVLGARFLNALYKGRLPQSICHDFEVSQGLTMAQVISKVYRQPMANRFLASLSLFIHQYINIKEVHQLIVDNFSDFLRRNVAPYQHPHLPISALGSIAYYYRDQLVEAIIKEGYTQGLIVRSPLQQLIAYHSV